MTLFRKCYLPRGIKREFNGSRDDGDSAKDSSDSIEFNVLRVLYGVALYLQFEWQLCLVMT